MTTPVDDAHPFGAMVVIATDQGAGRRYLCACGAKRWSCWGNARRHAESCPKASEAP